MTPWKTLAQILFKNIKGRSSSSVTFVFRGLLGSGQLHTNKLQRLHGAGTGL